MQIYIERDLNTRDVVGVNYDPHTNNNLHYLQQIEVSEYQISQIQSLEVNECLEYVRQLANFKLMCKK